MDILEAKKSFEDNRDQVLAGLSELKSTIETLKSAGACNDDIFDLLGPMLQTSGMSLPEDSELDTSKNGFIDMVMTSTPGEIFDKLYMAIEFMAEKVNENG